MVNIFEDAWGNPRSHEKVKDKMKIRPGNGSSLAVTKIQQGRFPEKILYLEIEPRGKTIKFPIFKLRYINAIAEQLSDPLSTSPKSAC